MIGYLSLKFIFEDEKVKLLLISKRFGSHVMLQSHSKRESFQENQHKNFVVSIHSWGRRTSESVVKEWHASINFNLTRYV